MFDGLPFLLKAAFANFMLVAFAQFLLPFLAWKIEKRFTELGIAMHSSAMGSLFTVSRFWGEARRLNETEQDLEVARYLKYYRWFWIYGIGSFVLAAVAMGMR